MNRREAGQQMKSTCTTYCLNLRPLYTVREPSHVATLNRNDGKVNKAAPKGAAGLQARRKSGTREKEGKLSRGTSSTMTTDPKDKLGGEQHHKRDKAAVRKTSAESRLIIAAIDPNCF